MCCPATKKAQRKKGLKMKKIALIGLMATAPMLYACPDVENNKMESRKLSIVNALPDMSVGEMRNCLAASDWLADVMDQSALGTDLIEGMGGLKAIWTKAIAVKSGQSVTASEQIAAATFKPMDEAGQASEKDIAFAKGCVDTLEAAVRSAGVAG